MTISEDVTDTIDANDAHFKCYLRLFYDFPTEDQVLVAVLRQPSLVIDS